MTKSSKTLLYTVFGTDLILDCILEFCNSSSLLCSTIFFKPFRKMFSYKLGKDNSIKYLKDSNFIDNINKILSETGRLLYLDFGYERIKVPDTYCFKYVHKLKIRSINIKTKKLQNCSEINLAWSQIDNITDLTNAEKIIISHSESLFKISFVHDKLKYLALNNCKNISDVAGLKDIQTLRLHNCDGINNVDILGSGKVYNLNLSFCRNIKNVSTLGNINTLNLSHCIEIFDVNCLKNVYNLNLSGCVKVDNVNNLGKITILNLSGCVKVNNVDCLEKVTILNLTGCKLITDVSKLKNVHQLNLHSCYGVTDVSMLGNVYKLVLPRPRRHNISIPVQYQ